MRAREPRLPNYTEPWSHQGETRTSCSPWPSCPSCTEIRQERDYQMAAVVYAYAFLFPEGTGDLQGD